MKNLNWQPNFTKVMLANGIIRDHEMTIIDVGAAGGFQPIWQIFGNDLRILGFEPNEAQFKNLVQSEKIRYFNVALGRSREEKQIYLTRWPYSSGTFPPDASFMSRFPNGKGMEIVNQDFLQTVDLDSFLTENGISDIDFIKLDTEGSELEILEGAIKTLDKVLAIEVEVAFTAYNIGRPLFSDIDSFMRKNNFSLYDLDTYRHSRTALPSLEADIFAPTPYGQILWADALYIKDIIGNVSARNTLATNQFKIIKAISLFELFCHPDSAIELLETAVNSSLLPEQFRPILDLLVPRSLGRQMSLDQYRTIAVALPQPL
ncbi:putative Methyltransferase, FkbM family [Gammaproteobacteria bacterium]